MDQGVLRTDCIPHRGCPVHELLVLPLRPSGQWGQVNPQSLGLVSLRKCFRQGSSRSGSYQSISVSIDSWIRSARPSAISSWWAVLPLKSPSCGSGQQTSLKITDTARKTHRRRIGPPRRILLFPFFLRKQLDHLHISRPFDGISETDHMTFLVWFRTLRFGLAEQRQGIWSCGGVCSRT